MVTLKHHGLVKGKMNWWTFLFFLRAFFLTRTDDSMANLWPTVKVFLFETIFLCFSMVQENKAGYGSFTYQVSSSTKHMPYVVVSFCHSKLVWSGITWGISRFLRNYLQNVCRIQAFFLHWDLVEFWRIPSSSASLLGLPRLWEAQLLWQGQGVLVFFAPNDNNPG